MANPHGTPIWYELLTPDHAAAKRFYDAVVGWTIEPAPAGDIDYRMIRTGADGSGGNVGGVMQLTDAMSSGGAKPGWLFYVGVDDVDTTVNRVTAAGGAVLMPPFDLPGVGRMAFVADPQGAPFYVMKGDGSGGSTSFAAGQPGRIGWNELWTTDATAALGFYEAVFGWTSPHSMPIGPERGYHFLHLDDVVLGALGASQQQDRPPRWTFYVQVPDLDAAIEQVAAGGGRITEGPHDVPGGSRVVVGTDPHGATFALVSPAKQES